MKPHCQRHPSLDLELGGGSFPIMMRRTNPSADMGSVPFNMRDSLLAKEETSPGRQRSFHADSTQ